MKLPDLPTEVWERILSLTDCPTQWQLRCVSRAFRQHVQDRLISEVLAAGSFTMPRANILMFNGFHSYRSEMHLTCTGPVHAFSPKADLTMLCAQFTLTKPLHNFRINRGDDIEADLGIRKTCTDLDGVLHTMEEEIALTKLQIRRHIIVSEDGQSLLVPIHLLWTSEYELYIPPPKPLEPWVAQFAGQVFMYGVPSQDWRSAFMSGANQPI
ncbi:hypothetical protein BCR37DRAFT_391835 [Protomyces lactucae-debilis]|uniref:F-box domain-containing protein n=1 Tax=Protomyces lactucae-debilis TaxID=2754530 RepID=A0A1Y2FJV8_PROLT|nr:uncharacterized protein BCR37DRAFT_391835 [Protomyces lactucae-debilis]ORY84230.1 hypothetical protein BCR37DRAFT_391835 [Protomyces lactucae-debilis]